MRKDIFIKGLLDCEQLIRRSFNSGGLTDRLNHTLAVAELASKKASSLGLCGEKARMLGLIHDVGYCTEYAEYGFHALDGYNALYRYHPKLAADMLYHTSTPEEASLRGIELPKVETSVYGAILSFADCRVDSKGNVISFEERLSDIVSRYGSDSVIAEANTKAWKRLALQEEKFGFL
ncbi:HDIG domain-containing metalloprotein [Vibrio owensii]|uniref:HDIG domain-containing metalloprotein n=1 Tax=Vibrio owensii TaxID=696485 RepID=UPI003CC62A15